MFCIFINHSLSLFLFIFFFWRGWCLQVQNSRKPTNWWPIEGTASLFWDQVSPDTGVAPNQAKGAIDSTFELNNLFTIFWPKYKNLQKRHHAENGYSAKNNASLTSQSCRTARYKWHWRSTTITAEPPRRTKSYKATCAECLLIASEERVLLCGLYYHLCYVRQYEAPAHFRTPLTWEKLVRRQTFKINSDCSVVALFPPNTCETSPWVHAQHLKQRFPTLPTGICCGDSLTGKTSTPYLVLRSSSVCPVKITVVLFQKSALWCTIFSFTKSAKAATVTWIRSTVQPR